jgi:hypothetical protein
MVLPFFDRACLLLPGRRTQDQREGDAWFLHDMSKESSANCGRPSRLTNLGSHLPVFFFDRWTDGWTTELPLYCRLGGPHDPWSVTQGRP